MPPLQMLSSESINLDGRREIKADLEASRVQLQASAASVQSIFTTRLSTCKNMESK